MARRGGCRAGWLAGCLPAIVLPELPAPEECLAVHAPAPDAVALLLSGITLRACASAHPRVDVDLRLALVAVKRKQRRGAVW